jgi:hypothetical protein
MDERLAFAKGCVVADVAERRATFDRGRRDVALDSGKLERQRCDLSREASQRLRLKTLDIDLDKVGVP